MRAREFLIEYDRNKTIQMMGKNLANAFSLGSDKRQFQYYNTTFQTPDGQPDLQKIVDYVLKNLEEVSEMGRQGRKKIEKDYDEQKVIQSYLQDLKILDNIKF